MTSTAIRSQGTTLGLGNSDSPLTYTTIANLISVTPPGVAAQDIEVTDLSSTTREWLQGIEDTGQADMEGYLKQSNAQHVALKDNAGTDTVLQFLITLSDSATVTFSGRVKNFQPGSVAVDGSPTFTASVKLSGAFTWG